MAKEYSLTDKETKDAHELHRQVHSKGIGRLHDYDRGRIDALIAVLSMMKHRSKYGVKGEALVNHYLDWLTHPENVEKPTSKKK